MLLWQCLEQEIKYNLLIVENKFSEYYLFNNKKRNGVEFYEN